MSFFIGSIPGTDEKFNLKKNLERREYDIVFFSLQGFYYLVFNGQAQQGSIDFVELSNLVIADSLQVMAFIFVQRLCFQPSIVPFLWTLMCIRFTDGGDIFLICCLKRLN
jgi:hypothetical protein